MKLKNILCQIDSKDCRASQFGAVITDYYLRLAAHADELFEFAYHADAAKRSIDHDGQAFAATGKQTFETPKLDKGTVYFYSMKSEQTNEGETQAQTKRVCVEAGKDVTVDFRTQEVASR